MDRGVITYTAAYLAGITASVLTGISPIPAVFSVTLLLPLSYLLRKNTIIFLLCSHLALFACGVGICSISCINRTLPPHKLMESIDTRSRQVQEKIAEHLGTLVPNPQSHAVVCALAIGEKGLMGKELKKSFSAAGAMHVLALSGLHIGIAFAIMYSLLFPLTFLSGGKMARNAIAMLFIAAYCIMAGCTPSVIRAATMIFLYKIAAGKYRSISNWDAIAISALITCTINPMQIENIGFQLSYSAVIGIALFFPTCNNAFLCLVPKWGGWRGYLWKGVHWLWGSIAISVCCQIATMPASLYYFGYSAPHFLLANLAAVPLATGIMYSLTIALPLQGIPLMGEVSAKVLNILIELLISAVTYIGG